MTATRLLTALCFVTTACGADEAPAPEPAAAAAPAVPKVDIDALRKKAAAEIAAEKAKQREEMRAVGVGTLAKKEKVGDKLELHFEFDNKSDKDLMRAEGTLEIKDEAGKLVKNLKLSFAQAIKPGKKATKKGRFPIDPADTDDIAFAKTPMSKLSIVWMPKHYRFADGTELITD